MNQKSLTVLNLITGAAAITTTTTHTGLDLSAYAVKREMKAVLGIGAVAGTTPSITVKVQDSPDNSTYTDVSGAAFTAVTTNGAAAQLHFQTIQRYVRAVTTFTANTTQALPICTLLVEQRVS